MQIRTYLRIAPCFVTLYFGICWCLDAVFIHDHLQAFSWQPPPPSPHNSSSLLQKDNTKYLNSKATLDKRLRNVGIVVDNATLDGLSLDWNVLSRYYGNQPVIHGLNESCHIFQKSVPRDSRHVGVAGMFNSGTNLLSKLLQDNCKLEVLWQVPWGKHAAAWSWNKRTALDYESYNKTAVLPVVMIRDPYEWMRSMCLHSYTVSYAGNDNDEYDDEDCPKLVNHSTGELISIQVGKTFKENFDSVAHYWNTWNQDYQTFSQEHPALRVRLEDLVLRPQQVVQDVCACAGGQVVEEFRHATSSAKTGPGHGKDRTDALKGWNALWQRATASWAGFLQVEVETASHVLNEKLMKTFGYRHPKM